MGRRVLWRHIWGYSICLCPVKRTPVKLEFGMSAKDCLSSLKGFCNFTVYNIIVTLSEKVKAQLSEKVKAQTNVDSVVF